MAVITVKNLSHYYQDGDYRRYVLKEINYSFEKGKFYCILGQSGSGKTTFLSLIGAMDSVQSGTIEFEGKPYQKYDLNTIRRNLIGMVFQSYNLIPHMTALENVLVAMTITENEIPKDKVNVAYNLLDYLGITKTKADRLVTRLSGGEQQRVAIARALATNVDVILADEPTGNVDEDTAEDIVAIFKKLAHEHNKCVIAVTHSPQVAAEADIVLTLRKGNFIVNE
ncbi:MAG: ABC transporter ATP-binding protein [Firmicutes bacterium]|jgi:putative ABC transport system ATP-binding protein|nr:ABC transporter ATP-binding protein [Bacillota bacterium]